MLQKLLVLFLSPAIIFAQNPCSGYWQYINTAGQTEGLLTLPLDNRYSEHNIQIALIVEGALTSGYVGDLSLLKNKDSALNDIKYGLSIQYRVRFPVQNPLPKLMEVRYNNQIMCLAEKDSRGGTTTITLKHTLLNGPPGLNEISSANNQQNDKGQNRPTQNRPVQNRPVAQNPPAAQYQQTRPNVASNGDFPSQNNQCGVAVRPLEEFTSLVVNGKPAQKGQFPWLAALYHNGVNENGFICGGSLVSSRAIVTAAHCIYNKNDVLKKTEEVLFYIGKFLINSFTNEKGFVVSPVSRMILHPDWNPHSSSYDADIAVATLSRVVQFTELVRPICLWTSSSNYYDIVNKQGVVAGYGKTHANSGISERPYWTALPIVDGNTCLSSKAEFAKITSRRTFCVGSRDGRGPCNGDSGGALAVQNNGVWYLRGVVSASLFDKELYTCDTNNYAVFTDVAAFTSWIQQYI